MKAGGGFYLTRGCDLKTITLKMEMWGGGEKLSYIKKIIFVI